MKIQCTHTFALADTQHSKWKMVHRLKQVSCEIISKLKCFSVFFLRGALQSVHCCAFLFSFSLNLYVFVLSQFLCVYFLLLLSAMSTSILVYFVFHSLLTIFVFVRRNKVSLWYLCNMYNFDVVFIHAILITCN